MSSVSGRDTSINLTRRACAWRITPGQTLRLRQWQDEAVVYNDLSGDTHLLGASAIGLLHILQDGAADEAALTAALGWEDGEPDRAEVAALLVQLEALALIEPAA